MDDKQINNNEINNKAWEIIEGNAFLRGMFAPLKSQLDEWTPSQRSAFLQAVMEMANPK